MSGAKRAKKAEEGGEKKRPKVFDRCLFLTSMGKKVWRKISTIFFSPSSFFLPCSSKKAKLLFPPRSISLPPQRCPLARSDEYLDPNRTTASAQGAEHHQPLLMSSSTKMPHAPTALLLFLLLLTNRLPPPPTTSAPTSLCL